MAIPENITRSHIVEAMHKIDKEGIPKNRNAKKYLVENDGKKYPCKLVISWANEFANGEELNPHPSIFNTYRAQDYLRSKDFIITKNF